MPKRVSLSRFVSDEAGGSLAPVLIALAVGVLLLSPFLANVSTRMLAARSAEHSLRALYAADSGVEYGLWKLNQPSSGIGSCLGSSTNLADFPGKNPPGVNGVPTDVVLQVILGSWNSLSPTPQNVDTGGASVYVSAGTIFVQRGAGSTDFWAYDTAGGNWTSLATPAGNSVDEPAGAMTLAGNGQIYALFKKANGGDRLLSYDPASDSWSNSPKKPPDNYGPGASVTTDGGDSLFVFRGGSTTDFWSYSVTGNSWSTLNSAPGGVDAGGYLASDGSNTIYAFRGGGHTAFWRYDIAGDSWSTLSSAPAGVGAGASLVYDGGDCIYALQGNGSKSIWAYTISAGSWSSLSTYQLPSGVGAGGSMVRSPNGTLYVMRGGGTKDSWATKVAYQLDAYQNSVSKLTTRIVNLSGSLQIASWILH